MHITKVPDSRSRLNRLDSRRKGRVLVFGRKRFSPGLCLVSMYHGFTSRASGGPKKFRSPTSEFSQKPILVMHYTAASRGYRNGWGSGAPNSPLARFSVP